MLSAAQTKQDPEQMQESLCLECGHLLAEHDSLWGCHVYEDDKRCRCGAKPAVVIPFPV